jgi:hypothetical protein
MEVLTFFCIYTGFMKSTIAVNAGLQEVHGSNLLFRKLREVRPINSSVFLILSGLTPPLQVLDLFIEKAWSSYVTDYSNPTYKYRSVTPEMVHSLLFK